MRGKVNQMSLSPIKSLVHNHNALMQCTVTPNTGYDTCRCAGCDCFRGWCGASTVSKVDLVVQFKKNDFVLNFYYWPMVWNVIVGSNGHPKSYQRSFFFSLYS